MKIDERGTEWGRDAIPDCRRGKFKRATARTGARMRNMYNISLLLVFPEAGDVVGLSW